MRSLILITFVSICFGIKYLSIWFLGTGKQFPPLFIEKTFITFKMVALVRGVEVAERLAETCHPKGDIVFKIECELARLFYDDI